MTNLFRFETDLWSAAGKLRAHSKRVAVASTALEPRTRVISTKRRLLAPFQHAR